MQAKVLGVERYALSRLEGLGNIERLAKGVYRMGGSLLMFTKKWSE